MVENTEMLININCKNYLNNNKRKKSKTPKTKYGF